MNNEIVNEIEKYVQSIMQDTSVHNYEHVNRVRNWAVAIAHQERYDRVDLVETAALLHDIGYTYTDEKNHGRVGSEKARNYLLENSSFTEQEISEIAHAIFHHSSNRGGEGKLLDILRDADMLDGLGAFGILRCIKPMATELDYNDNNIKGETWGMGVKEFDERMDSGMGAGHTIVDHMNFQISWYENLATNSAKYFAKPLVEFIKEYILQLESEVMKPQNCY